ncbi:MAG: ABC transporter substrate-binding protein [Solirubrobacterales bacterium]
MSRLRRSLRARAAITSAGALIGLLFAALGLTACGSSGTSATEGGTLNVLTPSFTDFEDPQLGYEATGWEARYNVYIPLLTYAHASGPAGTKVIPGLAESLPKLSNGDKTYNLTLRKGLKYSDGSPVKACDAKFAVQRIFDTNSKGAPLYTDIAGAEDYQSGKANDISGIRCNDQTGQVSYTLTAPEGSFTNKLGLQFSAPVPQDSPPKYDPSHPIPATGPYYFTNIDSGKSWTEERNPQWAKNNAKILPDLPSGHVDKITSTVVKNYSSATTDVEQNNADALTDPPPTDRLPEVLNQYSDRLHKWNTVSTYYFGFNSLKPPFNDLKVRQAVNYAVDPTAIERLYGGLMAPTQQVLPPDMPGYQKIELYPHDMAKAQALIKQANPSDKNITVWADDEDPQPKVGAYMQDVLKQLGFNAKLKVINGDIYFDVIGKKATPDVDIVWNDWFQDYPHPDDFFNPLLNGNNIAASANLNVYFNDPAINKKIEQLVKQPLNSATEAQYAALDKQVMGQAAWVPYGNRTWTTFTSDRVSQDSIIFSPVFQNDYSSYQFTK